MTSRIKFTDRGGRHSYTLDGERVPSVTTIIGATMRKQAFENSNPKKVAEFVANNLLRLEDDEVVPDLERLLDAIRRAAARQRKTLGSRSIGDYVDVLKGVPYAYRDAAAVRGVQVHAIAQRLVDGEEVDVPSDVDGYVDSCEQWIRDWKPHDQLTERAVANGSLRYAGRFDAIATLGDGKRWLLDYKTGVDVYPDVALQLVAYRRAEIMQTPDDDDVPMPAVDCCGVVLLGEFGYRFVEVAAGGDVWAMYQRLRRNYDYVTANDTYPHPSPLLREMTVFDRADFAS